MKRKDFEDTYDDFSSISFSSRCRKSRRLDAELIPFMEDDQRVRVPEALIGEGLSLATNPLSSSVVQTNASTIDVTPMVSNLEEKAIVPYCPPDTPFLKSPTSPEFSIIVNSNLIPGLKDHIFWPGNSKAMKVIENEVAANRSREASNDCLAVVPWVASQIPVTSMLGRQVMGMSEPMEAEEVEAEMMDTDESSNNNSAFEFGGIVEGAEGLQHWQQQQQHCMAPQLFQNTSTPITW